MCTVVGRFSPWNCGQIAHIAWQNHRSAASSQPIVGGGLEVGRFMAGGRQNRGDVSARGCWRRAAPRGGIALQRRGDHEAYCVWPLVSDTMRLETFTGSKSDRTN